MLRLLLARLIGFIGVGTEHHPADLVAVGGARVDDADDAAAVHDGDAVGQLEQLVEVLADQQHAGAAGPAFEQQLLGAPGGGDVEAAARVGGDHQRRRRRRCARTSMTRWMLPPDSEASGAVAVGGAKLAGLVALAGSGLRTLRPVDAEAACERGAGTSRPTWW